MVIVTEFGMAYRSLDSGATWSELPRGLGTGNNFGIIASVRSNNNNIFVASFESPFSDTNTSSRSVITIWTGITSGTNAMYAFAGSDNNVFCRLKRLQWEFFLDLQMEALPGNSSFLFLNSGAAFS